jgi:hypothetical protein
LVARIETCSRVRRRRHEDGKQGAAGERKENDNGSATDREGADQFDANDQQEKVAKHKTKHSVRKIPITRAVELTAFSQISDAVRMFKTGFRSHGWFNR